MVAIAANLVKAALRAADRAPLFRRAVKLDDDVVLMGFSPYQCQMVGRPTLQVAAPLQRGDQL